MHPDIPPGALISIIHRTHHVAINDRLQRFDLSAGQVSARVFLSKKQDITRDALAQHFHIDKATVAKAVRKLEDQGLISRETNPGNRRAVRIFLTGKGEALVPEILRIDRNGRMGSVPGSPGKNARS